MPGAKTELFARWGGGAITIADQGKSTGNRFFVDSGSATGADAAGFGQSPDSPFLTLDYAFNATNGVSASNGDIIYLMPGHAETINGTLTATLDAAGVTIIGQGVGAARPTLTLATAAAATVTISAASIKIKNVLFVGALDGLNTGLTVTGADFTAEDCEFRDTTDVEADIWVKVTSAVRPTFRRCFFNGYVDGDQQESAISLNAATNALIESCIFHGKYVTGAVSFDTACLGVDVKDSIFYSKTTTNLSKSVVDTATNSTWAVTECFDLGAGAGFSGGSGGALAVDDAAAIAALIGTPVNAGGTATLGAIIGDAANNTLVARLATITTMTDKIGTVTNAGGTASVGAILGDFANTSLVTRLTNILAAVGKPGAFAWGVCDAGMAASTTAIVSDDLAGYGADFFNGEFYMQVLFNANSATAAPEDEVRQITDYVTATGTFTCTAFSQNVETGDYILILHESAVMLGRDDANNTAATTNVVANADGSVLERLETIQAAAIVIDEFHDVPAANNQLNAQINEVIGNKTDATAADAVTETDTMVAYQKQLVTAAIAAAAAIVVIDEFHDVPAANNALNAQINEVVGNKADTAAAGAVTETDTLVGYVKQLVTNSETAATSLATNAAWDIRTVAKTGLALDAGSVTDVFTVANGPVQLLALVTHITTAVSANACNMRWDSDPTIGASNTPLCADLNIISAAIGDALYITGASGAALINAPNSTVAPLSCATAPIVVPGGIDLILQNADPTAGIGTVYLTYRPLSATAVVTAA